MAVRVTPGLVRGWVDRALGALAESRSEIDALNVFPVPDGDTGTNLYLTMEAASASIESCWKEGEPTLPEVSRALATGALLGARGNSGVILSQLLRGMTDVLSGVVDDAELDGATVVAVLRRGADQAYQAVARPVEGTILTVARAAADAADVAVGRGSTDASEVMAAAVGAAHDALDRTPQMLEALRLAGVVDAGGRGLVVMLDALAESVSGIRRVNRPRPAPVRVDGPVSHYGGPAYEVMFLLEADDDAIPGLRTTLDAMGDSLVVVGGDRLWNVHVHVDDAGAAIEAALAVGRPYRIRITHLEVVVDERHTPAGRALVVVTHGPGIASLMEEAGAAVVPAAPRQRPSTAEILAAVQSTHAGEVVILPSDGDTRAVAEAAAEQARSAGIRSFVVPTRSVVQSLAAVAVHDASARADDDVVAMTRAAGATRYAAVTVASRQALTTAGQCEVGDILGLVDGDIVAIGSSVDHVTRDLLSRMLAVGGELVTVVTGADATDGQVKALVGWLEATYPLVDTTVFPGGQPLWPFIVGVE